MRAEHLWAFAACPGFAGEREASEANLRATSAAHYRACRNPPQLRSQFVGRAAVGQPRRHGYVGSGGAGWQRFAGMLSLTHTSAGQSVGRAAAGGPVLCGTLGTGGAWRPKCRASALRFIHERTSGNIASLSIKPQFHQSRVLPNPSLERRPHEAGHPGPPAGSQAPARSPVQRRR